jgi:small subunit ribosomal protein S8e
LDVVYNATNNELVRTKTVVKNAIVQIDATPFRQWYEAHYGVKVAKKRKGDDVDVDVKKSSKVQKKLAKRQAIRVLETDIETQIDAGRFLAAISSRPGQSGRADGYVLEGKELEFYKRKLDNKKNKK